MGWMKTAARPKNDYGKRAGGPSELLSNYKQRPLVVFCQSGKNKNKSETTAGVEEGGNQREKSVEEAKVGEGNYELEDEPDEEDEEDTESDEDDEDDEDDKANKEKEKVEGDECGKGRESTGTAEERGAVIGGSSCQRGELDQPNSGWTLPVRRKKHQGSHMDVQAHILDTSQAVKRIRLV